MKSKINLVILTPGFAADDEDSTAIPSLQLYLAGLHSLYPEVRIQVVSFHYPFRTGDYEWKGLAVHAAGGAGNKAFKILLWIRILRWLIKYRKSRGIDIIHTFWLSDTALVGLLFGRMTGIPVISTCMGQDVKRQNRYLRLIGIFKPVLIPISDAQANLLGDSLKSRIRKVIPFGIDPACFHRTTAIREIDILSVGSLNKTKNYKEIIETIGCLVNDFPALNCSIIGEGTERKQIEELIAARGLGGRITLCGELPYREVIKKMHESKILLHTAPFEGQGLVITEALAAGAYVVCYPVGIAWNLNNSKLRTGRNREELKQHITDILKDEGSDYSSEIIYTIEDTCRKYIDVYTDLLSLK